MGVFDDLAKSFGDTMATTSKAVQTATKRALRKAGATSKEELDRKAPIVPGRDKRFSRMGGARLSVKLRYDTDRVTVMPRGPWPIAEEGAPPHTALAWGHPFQHPGTRGTQGRRSWTLGQAEAFRQLEVELPAEIAEAVAEAFERS